jgi:hypothetical protein|tara:strand:+ start:575 stop:748 length:174 start_codon:yes stop_codon:yes gene_type:complete
MSTRGSRLEARNQRDVVSFEGRVKAWDKRCASAAASAATRAVSTTNERERERERLTE